MSRVIPDRRDEHVSHIHSDRHVGTVSRVGSNRRFVPVSRDNYSWLADESAAPPCDFLMCEKVVVRPGVTFFGTFNASLPSFPAGGSGAAGETDVGPGVPNAECRVDGSWTELCARETCLTTPKQQKRCVHKNNITRKRTDTAYDVCIILRVIDSYSLPVKSK